MSASAFAIVFSVFGAIAIALAALIVIRRHHDDREGGGATRNKSDQAGKPEVAAVDDGSGASAPTAEGTVTNREADLTEQGKGGQSSDQGKPTVALWPDDGASKEAATVTKTASNAGNRATEALTQSEREAPEAAKENTVPECTEMAAADSAQQISVSPPVGERDVELSEAILGVEDVGEPDLSTAGTDVGFPAENATCSEQDGDEEDGTLTVPLSVPDGVDVPAVAIVPEEQGPAIDLPPEKPAPERRSNRRPRGPARHRDRRGGRRAPARRAAEEQAVEAASAPIARQAEAKLRIAIDWNRQSARLSVVLLRPEGFPETIEVDVGGVQLVDAFFEGGRYDDIDIEWTAEFLTRELRFTDKNEQLQWLRSARPFHLFAAIPEEPDLVSVSAARAGVEHAIVCRVDDIDAVSAAATGTGSPPPTEIQGWESIPEGWAVMTGYSPQHAIENLIDTRLRPLDPGVGTEISFDGGMEIRSRTFAEYYLPRILIEPLPSGCTVSIGGQNASQLADGSWVAPGWEAPGDHLIDVVPGPSLTYLVQADPGSVGGWDAWNAHADTISACGKVPWARATICGARIGDSEEGTVVACESRPTVVALGARAHVRPLFRRSDVPAAIGVLPFVPAFLIVSWGLRRHQGSVIWLSSNSAEKPPRMGRVPDMAWVSTVRATSARRLPVLPNSDLAKSAWRSAAAAARRVRRRKT